MFCTKPPMKRLLLLSASRYLQQAPRLPSPEARATKGWSRRRNIHQQSSCHRLPLHVLASLHDANLPRSPNSASGNWRCIRRCMNGSVGDWTRVAMARQLHIGTHTVGKYLRMEHFVDQRHHPGGSSVEPYRAYLEQRWQEGCRMIKTLWEELKVQGFTGSYQSVWLFTRKSARLPGHCLG